MATDSFFALACASIIALLVGSAFCFGGYRFFLILLPIWGFVVGFGFGAQTMQAIFGVGFLATVTSWVVGFIVALVFAALSYLFYVAAVAIIAGSLGYGLAVGLLQAIGLDFGFLVWLIGIVAAVALAFVTIRFNIQKWVIMAATAFLGAAVIIGTFLAMFGGLPSSELVQNPVRFALASSPLWALAWAVLGIFGIIAQVMSGRTYELEPWEDRI